MQVTRQDAVAICVALGFDPKLAGKWNKKKMREKLVKVVKLVKRDELAVPDDWEDAERLSEVLAGIVEAGGEVELVEELAEVEEVVGDGAAEVLAAEEAEGGVVDKEAEAVPEKPKGKKKDKQKKKAKAEKVKVPVEGKDQFGFRSGTKASKFFACLTEEPKTVGELVAQSGVKQQRGYLPRLIEAKLVAKEGNKYRLAQGEL